MKKNIYMVVYERLLGKYGPRGWWPVTPPGSFVPEYTGGPKDERGRFEVAVGAILTQNTAWKNVSRAIENLNRANLMDPGKLVRLPEEKIAGLIRSAGYFNQKAKRLKEIARFFIEKGNDPSRESLLEIKGVGPETADSILLYAYNEPHFVVDAYTRRIFSRIGITEFTGNYEDIKKTFEANLEKDPSLYQEYHALIVEHGKRFCRKRPICSGCPLEDLCGKGIENRS